jgi:hypothetical protein
MSYPRSYQGKAVLVVLNMSAVPRNATFKLSGQGFSAFYLPTMFTKSQDIAALLPCVRLLLGLRFRRRLRLRPRFSFLCRTRRWLARFCGSGRGSIRLRLVGLSRTRRGMVCPRSISSRPIRSWLSPRATRVCRLFRFRRRLSVTGRGRTTWPGWIRRSGFLWLRFRSIRRRRSRIARFGRIIRSWLIGTGSIRTGFSWSWLVRRTWLYRVN